MSSITKHQAGLMTLAFLLSNFNCNGATLTQLSSPNKQVSVTLNLDKKGQLSYQLFGNKLPVLKPSGLGIRLKNTWIALSETGMDGQYSGTILAQKSPEGRYEIRVPQTGEATINGASLPQAKLPFHSPWRIIAIGELSDIFASTLGTDLALPSVKNQYSI